MAIRGRRWTAAAVTLSLAALLAQANAFAAGNQVGAHQTIPSSVNTTSPVAAASATGSSAVSNLGAATGWKVLTSAQVTQPGEQVSSPGLSTSGWLSVTNDGAGAPGTEVNALLQNGACPDVFFADHMRSCFGQMTKVGPETIKQFSVPWWYRTDFTASTAEPGARLLLNGVVGKADVWMNGTQLASAATVNGAYSRHTFDVADLLRSGTNTLAIKIYPNDPGSMLTLDHVDWAQIPPDNNTGIQFPVQLQQGGPLLDSNAHVVQNTAADLGSSALTVKSDLTNVTSTAQTGTVTATVTPPGDDPPITVTQTVTVPANTTRTVSFTPADHPSLTLARPRIWWPYQLGGQPMYELSTAVSQDGQVLGTTTGRFGIRTVTSRLTGPSTATPDGVRAFKVNDVPLVIRGGGWDPDLFLRYDPADTAKQIALIKSMGVNTIRVEGHLMPDDWYRQMDDAGILVNAGFQCCDFWESTSYTSADKALYQQSAQTFGQVLRNHPAVFSFEWSDNNPTAEQESLALAGFAAADYGGPFIASAEYKSSPQLGPAGEKEGPYDWVAPNYWYDTSHFDSGDTSLTNAGGAWGFDSEQSAGNTVPTLDSINRFLSPADQAALWQKPAANQYHNNYEGTRHSGYHFGTLFNLDTAITQRYGPWSSLSQYVQKAQVQNYENTRAQFEAFIDHSTNQAAPSTGTIYWQMNKGWPTLLWSLYNNDGDQAGAYFGAQRANKPLHALYTLDDGTVTLDNLGGTTQDGVTVESKVYDLAGKLLDDQTSTAFSLASQQVRNDVLTPKTPAGPAGTVYFVELLVHQAGAVVDRNVYWESTTGDITDWAKTIGQPQATMTRYADLNALQTLPRASVSATATTTSEPGPAGADRRVTVTLTNDSAQPTVGFFLRADLRRGTASGLEQPGDNALQSAIWSGNDTTLWPGESETFTATYHAADLHGAAPVVSVSGWNVPKFDVVTG